ncbi:MAG: hypothetical protein NT129_04490 [Candidatus Aenigmarchaeota archaeon]|nr:hypothetical protein [Candidatus Aenigmarchaeota archaeon]
MSFFEDIRNRVFGKKRIIIEELEKAAAGPATTAEPVKEKKEGYQTKDDNDNTELTDLILIQKVDNIATKLEEHDRKIAGKIDGIPDQIMPLLKQFRVARTPVAKQTIADEVMKKMRLGVEELIDVGIVSIIKEYSQISSLELRNQAQKKGICASASVYRHLENLIASGKIKKERFKKRVLYTIPITTEEQKTKESEQKPAIPQESNNENVQ